MNKSFVKNEELFIRVRIWEKSLLATWESETNLMIDLKGRAGISLFQGGCHRPKQEATQPRPSPENWIKDSPSMAPTWTLCTRTQEKGTVTPQETCLWVSGSLQWRRGSGVACCRVGGADCSSTCPGSFEGGHHYLHYLHHSIVKSLSRVWLFATPWNVSYQAPLSMGGKNTGAGCHFLLQGIFPTQGPNSGLPHCKQTFYHLSHQGSPSLECTTIVWVSEVAQSCLTLYDPMNCSLPDSSIYGIFQARIRKWFTISFSSVPCFVRTFHHDLSILGGPTRHGS